LFGIVVFLGLLLPSGSRFTWRAYGTQKFHIFSIPTFGTYGAVLEINSLAKSAPAGQYVGRKKSGKKIACRRYATLHTGI
jgi:hypothetical protein